MVCGAKVVEKERFDVDSERLRKAADRENGGFMAVLDWKPAIGDNHRLCAEHHEVRGSGKNLGDG